MLIHHQHGGFLQRSLSKLRPRRNRYRASRGHGHVPPTGEHVERIRIHEAAVIVSQVNHHAIAHEVFGIKIESELVERLGAHIVHVHIPQSPIRRLRHVGAAFVYPLPIEQPLLGVGVHRTHHHATFHGATLQRELNAATNGIQQSPVQVIGARECLTIDGHDAVPNGNTRNSRRTKGNHALHLKGASTLVTGAIHANPELPNRRHREAAGTTGAGMRSVQLTNHQLQQAAQLVGGLRGAHVRRKALAHRIPVHTVHGGIVELITQRRPCLLEGDQLVHMEIGIKLGVDGHTSGPATRNGNNHHPSGIAHPQLAGVGGETDDGFATGGGGDLPRGGRLTRQLVE